MWFVWVSTPKGPMPEAWSEELGDYDKDGEPRPCLAKWHLPESHMNIPLNVLSNRFPLNAEG